MPTYETMKQVKAALKTFAEKEMMRKDGHVLLLVSDDDRIPCWWCVREDGKACDWEKKAWPNRDLRVPRLVKREWLRHIGSSMPDLPNIESFEIEVASGRSNRRWRFTVTYEPERYHYSRSFPWVLTRRLVGSDDEQVISVYRNRFKAYIGMLSAAENQAVDTFGHVVGSGIFVEPRELVASVTGAIRGMSTDDAARKLKYLVDMRDAADSAIRLVSAVMDTLREDG